MIGQKVRIDFNQGLDARLILVADIAQLLSKIQWIRYIRMSCDTDAMLGIVLKAVERLKYFGINPHRIFVYLLITTDIKSAENRALRLKEAGVEVFAQPYRDFENTIEPTREMKALARWVNRKEIFKSTSCFAEYKWKRDIEKVVKK